MYSDRRRSRFSANSPNLPESVGGARSASLCRRRPWCPTGLWGVDQIIAEAVGMVFPAAPLTPQQVKELIQIFLRSRTGVDGDKFGLRSLVPEYSVKAKSLALFRARTPQPARS